MGHIDICLESLRRLIRIGDVNSIQMAENAIKEYWATTPPKARKSGLLYIQQILHDERDALNRLSRTFADTVDAYIEKKLVTQRGCPQLTASGSRSGAARTIQRSPGSKRIAS
jgi:hypothetical protein